MRRIAAVLALPAAGMVVAPSPAIARTLHTVVSKTGLPAAIDALRLDCPTHPEPIIHETTAYRHVFGAGFPPSGKGSLSMLPAADKLPGLGMIVGSGNLADVTTLRISVYNLDTTRLTGFVYVKADDADDQWVLSATDVQAGPGYRSYSLLGMNFTWFDATSGTTDTTDGPGTIAQFLAAHPQHSGGYDFAMLSGDCSNISTRPVYFDHIDCAVSGHGTHWDFESRAGGLTIAENHGTVGAGDAVRLSTVLSDGGRTVGGRTVTLWAFPLGAARFTKVRTVTTSAEGHASASLRQKKTTTYQWRFAGSSTTQPTRSPTKIVHVTH